MQENEFEKRLQGEMEEFRLRPSGVVWDKIEDELKKKKRRRVVFYIFLLAGLSLVGYSGYFLLTTNTQNLTQRDAATTEKKVIDNREPKPTGDDTQKATPGDQEIANQEQAQVEEQIIVRGENKKVANEEEQIIKKKSRVNKISGELRSTEPAKKNVPKASENNNSSSEKVIARQSDKNNKSVVEPTTIPTGELAENNIKVDEKVTTEKKEVNAAKSDNALAAIEKQDQKLPVNQQKQKKKTSAAIKWGLDLSAGVSQISNKAFSFSAVSQSADALNVATPGNGNAPGGSASIGPSDELRGFAFKAGIVGELNISKRSSVSAGLSYAYYSNNLKTGSPKDSSFVLRTMTAQSVALNSYYQGSQVMEYTNHYHFIQLPIYYQLQLNKGVKLPLIWSIGVAPAYLFSTNALIYDTASRRHLL